MERFRGSTETLPSVALGVKAYACYDPVTRRRHHLSGTISSGGRRYPARMAASLADPASFRAHLVGIARVEVSEQTDGGEGWIGDFELEVFEPRA